MEHPAQLTCEATSKIDVLRKIILSSLAGSALQSVLMFAKSWFGLLPYLQPYEAMQARLKDLFGTLLPGELVWTLSLINGALLIGGLFGLLYARLPMRHAMLKGLTLGLVSWALFLVTIFPLLGYGLFGLAMNHGAEPALFSFMMIVTYSVTYGYAYERL
jgi:hypothetical protein